jgi:UDP-N-acetyl-D-mannosaminuronic acid dehydrogenase
MLVCPYLALSEGMEIIEEFDVCVVGGAGHIGLPLSICFANEGLEVLIYDINQSALSTIGNGEMPFQEAGAEEKLPRLINSNLSLTSKMSDVGKAAVVVVTIGTPVDEHLNPTYHEVKNFFLELAQYLTGDQLVILRSTIYPSTTEKIRNLLQDKIPGIEVCFCPERIAEGKAMTELYTLPQIVSGFDEKAIRQASELFRKFTNDIIILSPLEAELTKLFNNSWRYLEFAAANQFYMIAEAADADFYKIYHAMTHKYPRSKSFPRPGFAAGPCLFKDTMQISAYAKNNFFLGHSAMLVNEGLPNFIVDQAKRIHRLDQMTAGILGMAFKAESDDPRESLSYKLRKVLESEAGRVLCSDEYIRSDSFVDAEGLVREADIIFVGAPHRAYRELRIPAEKIVIDVWAHLERQE